MDNAERERIKAYIASKNEAMRAEGKAFREKHGANADAVVRQTLSDVAARLTLTPTGPNSFHLSAKPKK